MRPVSCVLTGYVDDQTTWCGRQEAAALFLNASHAALNAKQGGDTLPCPACVDAICATLQRAQELVKRAKELVTR